MSSSALMLPLLLPFVVVLLAPLFGHGKEILPSNCDCRDWYGACRKQGEAWTDEQTWMYRCAATDAGESTFVGCQLAAVNSNNRFGQPKQLGIGQNQTVDGFWAVCETNEIRQKLEFEPHCIVNGTVKMHVGEQFRQGIFQWLCLETGRWVTGCYFQNETGQWTLLKIGETGYNGLIRHTCDRYKDNPGIVQYHAEIRDDIPYKNPTNKGDNKNLPAFIDKRLKNVPTEWIHQNAALFVAENATNVKVRYLPASRVIKAPPTSFPSTIV